MSCVRSVEVELGQVDVVHFIVPERHIFRNLFTLFQIGLPFFLALFETHKHAAVKVQCHHQIVVQD